MYRLPEALDHRHLSEGFSCGHESLDRFLIETAAGNQRLGYTRTMVISGNAMRVAGYHSLAAALIERLNTTRSISPHPAPREIPVALLARLAVHRTDQGKGLGAALLRHALLAALKGSETVAFRAVMVHALDPAADAFYRKYGFRSAKGLERTLLLPMDEIAAALK